MRKQPQGPSRSVWRAIAAMLVSIVAAGCGSETAQTDGEKRSGAGDSDEITIGVAWPFEARNELLFTQGLEMALDEINQAGGVDGRSVRLVQFDDQESVNEGRLVAQRFVDDPEITAVIGHLQSHVTVPAAAIYNLGEVVLIAPAATSADLTRQGYSKVFRATFTDSEVGEQMAEYAMAQGYQRIAVYYVRSIYGRSLANAFEERLMSLGNQRVVARDSYDSAQSLSGPGQRAIFSRWQQLGADAIFLAGEVPSAGRLIAEIRAAGIEAPILGGDAMSSPALIHEGGSATEGTVVACFFHPEEPRPKVQDFVAAFDQRFGVAPDAAAALAYDSLSVLVEGMRKAATLAPADVAAAIRGLESWDGVTGNFAFDEQGNLAQRQAPRVVVRDGQFLYLGDDNSLPG